MISIHLIINKNIYFNISVENILIIISLVFNILLFSLFSIINILFNVLIIISKLAYYIIKNHSVVFDSIFNKYYLMMNMLCILKSIYELFISKILIVKKNGKSIVIMFSKILIYSQVNEFFINYIGFARVIKC